MRFRADWLKITRASTQYVIPSVVALAFLFEVVSSVAKGWKPFERRTKEHLNFLKLSSRERRTPGGLR